MARWLPAVSPDQPLYRIGRQPDPWSPPDWSRALPDRTFGNRFDDSAGQFRVLYAASSRLACFMETLAHFRKAPANLAEQLAAISDDKPDPDLVVGGTVPASWLTIRKMGRASVSGQKFADIYSSEWLAYLRPRFEVELIARGVIDAGSDFDVSLIMQRPIANAKNSNAGVQSRIRRHFLPLAPRKRSAELGHLRGLRFT